MTTEPKDRFIRQASQVPAKKREQAKALVVGTGAIGRQVAIQLAAIGVPDITLVDFDNVEEHNITSQGFSADQIGLQKVEAVCSDINRIDPTIKVTALSRRWAPVVAVSPAVFCCVDSMTTRKEIYERYRDAWSKRSTPPGFLADGRMLSEVFRVLAITDEESRQYYETTFYSDDEVVGGACTSRSTIYVASMAAGFLLARYTKWLRGMSCPPDTTVNVFANQLDEQPG